MKRALVVLPVSAGVLWGSVGVFVRLLNDAGMNNMTVLSVRVFFAAMIMFAGLLIYDKNLLKIKFKDIGLFICSGVLGMVGLNYCYNEAINQLTLSLAAVLLSLSPIFVMILAAILFKERLTRRKLVCSVFAVAGCLLVSGVLESGLSTDWTWSGIFIGSLAAVFYALYSIFSRVAMGKAYDAFTITFYSMLIAFISIIPFTDWSAVGEYIGAAPLKAAVFLIVHSLCTSVLPYVFFTLGIKYIETGKASILAAGGEPSAAMIFGWIFYREIPSVLSLAGLAITIIALAFLCLADQRENKL